MKRKLTLQNLEVTSFTTSLDDKQKETVGGGTLGLTAMSVQISIAVSNYYKIQEYYRTVKEGCLILHVSGIQINIPKIPK